MKNYYLNCEVYPTDKHFWNKNILFFQSDLLNQEVHLVQAVLDFQALQNSHVVQQDQVFHHYQEDLKFRDKVLIRITLWM